MANVPGRVSPSDNRQFAFDDNLLASRPQTRRQGLAARLKENSATAFNSSSCPRPVPRPRQDVGGMAKRRSEKRAGLKMGDTAFFVTCHQCLGFQDIDKTRSIRALHALTSDWGLVAFNVLASQMDGGRGFHKGQCPKDEVNRPNGSSTKIGVRRLLSSKKPTFYFLREYFV